MTKRSPVKAVFTIQRIEREIRQTYECKVEETSNVDSGKSKSELKHSSMNTENFKVEPLDISSSDDLK